MGKLENFLFGMLKVSAITIFFSHMYTTIQWKIFFMNDTSGIFFFLISHLWLLIPIANLKWSFLKIGGFCWAKYDSIYELFVSEKIQFPTVEGHVQRKNFYSKKNHVLFILFLHKSIRNFLLAVLLIDLIEIEFVILSFSFSELNLYYYCLKQICLLLSKSEIEFWGKFN